jgi:hypothetical protein
MPKIDLVDVSRHQDPPAIDWAQVTASGVTAAIVRTGYGGDPDPSSAAHVARIRDTTASLGTYHYVVPIAGEEKKQADLMVAEWTKYKAAIAPAADLEARAVESPIVASKDWDRVADWLDAFCERAESQLAANVIIYTGTWFNQLPQKRGWAYRGRALWVAAYTRPGPPLPWPWDEYAIWQHSANTIWSDGSWGAAPKTPGASIVASPGKVPGFAGEIDCNALGNVTLDFLRTGKQPRCPLDLSQVIDRQRALRRLGENAGNLDGQWGPRSSAALASVQAALGIAPTGAWDAATETAVASALDKT